MNKVVSMNKNELFESIAVDVINRRLTPEHTSMLIQKDFEYLNANYRYPNPGEGMRVSSDSFRSYGYGIAAIDRPSVAIKSLFESSGLLDCERSVLAVKYSELLRDMGGKFFDKEFSRRGRELKITSSLPFYNKPRNIPLIDVLHLDSADEVEIGDWVYLENDTTDIAEDRKFLFSGEHCIVVGLSRFSRTNDQSDIVVCGFTGNSDYQKMRISDWNKEIFEGKLKGLYKHNGQIIVRRSRDLSGDDSFRYKYNT